MSSLLNRFKSSAVRIVVVFVKKQDNLAVSADAVIRHQTIKLANSHNNTG
jgi:hypothetical protein